MSKCRKLNRKQSCTLPSLPDDCLNEVLTYLYIAEAMPLMSCCKEVRTTVRHTMSSIPRDIVFPSCFVRDQRVEKALTIMRNVCAQGIDIRGVTVNETELKLHFLEDILSLAACHDDWRVIDLLLEVTEVSVNCHSAVRPFLRLFNTPLSYAARYNSLGSMRRLLQEDDIDVDVSNPLVAATCAGHLSAVELLLGEPDINVNYPDRETALSAAAGNGRLDILERLLQHPDIDVNRMQPLVAAVAGGHIDVIRRLGREKALDVNDGRPAIAAAHRGNVDVMAELRKLNVDLNCVAHAHRTPLIVAIEKGHAGMLEYLVKQKDAVDVNKQSVLHVAAMGGKESDVGMILSRDDVDVNRLHIGVDVLGPCGMVQGTPLQLATRFSNVGVVRVLLQDDRIDVNKRDSRGRTALHGAAMLGSQRSTMYHLLLSHDGIDPTIKDNDGQTAEWHYNNYEYEDGRARERRSRRARRR